MNCLCLFVMIDICVSNSRIMFGFHRYPIARQKHHQKRSHPLLSSLMALGMLGASGGAAIAITPESSPMESSMTGTEISLDLGDILRNAIRYVQVANISNEEEVEIGRQINDMLLEQQYDLYQNRRVNEYVDRLGQRLVAASDRRDIPYTFQVVESEEINAFATPGGFIYVTTGLLQEADNEAQLASVLAHEIAHVNERHSIEALRQTVLAQGIAETAGIDMNTLAQVGYQLAVGLPRSRGNEYEADEVGLDILQSAGYAPIAFVQFFNQLQERGGTPEFLRTHPITENRIEAIEAQIEPGSAYAGGGLNETAYQNQISPLL